MEIIKYQGGIMFRSIKKSEDFYSDEKTLSIFNRNTRINNYWQGDKIIYFTESISKIDRMLSESPAKKILLTVKNIDDKLNLDITWGAYFDDNKLDPNFVYFIVDEQLLKRVTSDKSPNGILKNTFENYDVIGATIGQDDTITPSKFIIISLIKYDILDSDSGGHGEPPGVGAKIPSE